MNTLFLEPIAGIAGDMFVAAFIDAGLVSLEELRALPDQLGLADVHFEAHREERTGITGTALKITWAETTIEEIAGTPAEAEHHSQFD